MIGVRELRCMVSGGSGGDRYLFEFGFRYHKDWTSFTNGPVVAMANDVNE